MAVVSTENRGSLCGKLSTLVTHSATSSPVQDNILNIIEYYNKLLLVSVVL